MEFGTGRTIKRLFLFGTLLGVFFALFVSNFSTVFAAAGINQQINFQGRLLNAAGATVPDGYYNIEFKIYQDGDGQSVGDTTGSPAGALKWTEDYLGVNSQAVKVQNGFMSVKLGSVNAFGSSIDWNQDTLWLSMNIGSTGTSCTPFSSCTPDGEMVPMQAMTTAVYALNALQLGGLTAASFGQLSQNQVWTGYNTYKPTTDSATAFQLQNQSAGTSYVTGDSTNNQLVLGTASSLSGKLAFATVGGGAITVIPTSSASSFTITLPAETGTVCTTAATSACSVAGSGYVQLAPLAVQADSTTHNSIFINKTNATGYIVELQKSGSDVFKIDNTGNITATGTYNSNAFNSTTLTFGGANPTISPSTSNTGLTTQANGTGTLTLNTGGAGAVNIGTTNSTAVGLGNSASTNTILGATNINTSGSATTSINTGPSTGNTAIGNATGTFALASSALNVTTAGAVSGVTTLATSSTINGQTISATASLTGTLAVSGIITATSLGASSNDSVVCRNGTNQLAACTSTFIGSTTYTLQGAYTNSTNPEIVLNATNGGLTLRNDATNSLAGNLLEVQDNAGTTTFFGVSKTAISATLGYTQTGSGANTFSGTTNITGAGAALAVTNSATIGTGLTVPLVQTADGATASTALSLRSGTTTGGSGLSTGTVSLKSGDGSGTNTSTGTVTIDSGAKSGSGTAGAVNIGTTNSTSVGLGNASSTNTISGTSNFGGTTAVTGSNTLTVGTGLTSLGGGLSVTAGVTTLSGGLTVTNAGNVAYQKSADVSTTGNLNNLSVTGSLVRLTGVSLQTLTGLAGGVDGRVLTIINAAGQDAVVNNNDTVHSSGANVIITGTGSSTTLPIGATASFVYDSGASVWRASSITSTGGAGVNTIGAVSSTPTANGATITGTTLNLAVADDTHAGLLSTSNQLIGGSKTFQALISGALGLTVSGAATNINAGSGAAYNYDTNINTGSSTGNINIANGTGTGTIGIGSTNSGALSLQSGSTTGITAIGAISITSSSTFALSSTNLNVATTGVVTLKGGQTQDINTAVTGGAGAALAIQPGTSTGASNNGASTTIKGGNGSGTTNVTGGALTLQGGSATGGSGNRIGGNVSIDAGAGGTTNGTVSVGTTNSVATAIGNATGTFALASSALNVTTAGAVSGVTTLATSSTINGQTISATASLTGTLAVSGIITATSLGASSNDSVVCRNGTNQLAACTSTFIGSTTYTLQGAYTNSTNPEIVLNATNGGLTLRNDATNSLAGNLLEVQDNAGTTTFFGVSKTAISATLGYTQTGSGANTFSGTTNITGAGAALAVTNSATIGTGLTVPLVQTADGATASTALSLRSGTTTGGSGLSTGTVSLKSGDGSGTNTSTGTVTIDSGAKSGSGTAGAVNIGAANASAVNLGNTTGTFQLTSNALNISTVGALTGVTGITTSGGYTQSGSNANTLTGDTTISRLSVNGGTSFGTVEKFRVNTPTTVDNLANILFTTGATTNKGLVVQGLASQTADLFQAQSSTGSVLLRVSAVGVVGSTDTTAASTDSAATTVRTGNTSGSTSNTGALTLKSGDANTGASGAVTIDSGNASGGAFGAINIGITNSVATTVGNTTANTNTLIQGGSGATAIQLNQGLGGTITIGTNGSGSNVQIVCGVIAGAGCGFANNATDHSTTIGSATGTSLTTVKGGTGGITLTGNISASGTYNTNTFTSTALTFAGASPIISASTTNTGLSLQSNGTGILALDSSGTGTVNLGTTNAGFVNVGNITAATQTTIKGGTGSSALALQVGSGGSIGIGANNTNAVTIGSGSTSAGTILIQGGASSAFSVTNATGSSVLKFAAPSTAGIVTYQLPNGGVVGTTYSVCTTFVVCSGYSASGSFATTALGNLAGVAINTSLLPASNNAINVGSSALTFANGYYGTSVISPSYQTLDQSAASTPSTSVSFQSGNSTGTGSPSSTGTVTIKSGDSTNSSSGSITIDTGAASTTKGTITIGATSNSITLGNTSATTTTLIQGGTGTGVSIQSGSGGVINIGTTNPNGVTIGSTSNTNSLVFGQSTAGETVNIENGATAAATTVNILSGVGTAGIATLNMGNNTRITGISLGNISPAAARSINIGNNTGTGNNVIDTINIATNATTVAGGNTVHIADGTPTGSGTNLVTIGSTANASSTIIQGGTGASAIQLTQATGAGIIIGNANTASTVTVQCGAGTSSNCGFGVNGNDHSTYVGSTNGVSNTVIQSGSGGINLNGAVTTSSTINTDTLSATALTFSGANPVISASTVGTGMTLQANGTGILTLNTSGAGTVNLGTTNTTTIGVGNTTSATQTLIQGGTGASALGLQVGTSGTISVGTTAAATLNIGNTTAATVTNISGGTSGTAALNLQVGNGGAINLGTTAQTSIQNIGNTSASTTTLINGGTSTIAIQLLQGAGGTVTVGGNGAGSNVNVQCGASATACNFGTNATDHSTTIGSTTGASLTTIQAGTSGISLAQNTTISANYNLSLASGTGRYIQTYTGTTSDALSVTATSLTTASAMKVTSANNSAANTTWNGIQFNSTNNQGTTAVSTGYIFGADFEFNQSATVVGNNEAAVNIAIAANSGSPTDNIVSSILNIANNDTGTGNLIQATDGIRINATTASNIVNGITFNGTFQTNLLSTSTNNYTVTNGGAVTQAGNLTFSGASPVTIQATAANGALNIQANGTGSVTADTTGAGTVSIGATYAATVNVGGSNATNVAVSCAASAASCNFGANTTDHTTNIGSSTSTSLTTIQGGTAGITLTSGNTVASILSSGMTVKTISNSATAFRVVNTGSNAVISVDTSTPALKIFAGAGGANYLGLTYNDGTSTGTIAASSGTTAVGSGTGAISVLAGTGSAITITANATSLWRTTAGTLTMQSGTSSDLILTSGSNIVQVSGTSVVKLGQSAGDPGTCTAGAIVYNTTSNTLRGCQGGTLTWYDLVNVTTATLQQSYTASTGGTTPEIKLDTTRGALDIQGDNAGSVTALFNVRMGTGSGLGTSILAVTATGVTTMHDASGNSLLIADGVNGLVQVGNSTPHSTNGTPLVLDSFQSATAGAEPTELDGAMYYDAEAGLFRCAANGFWNSCGINQIESSYVFEDEFLSGATASASSTNVQGVGDLNWNVNATTSCSIAYNQTGPALTHDHPGTLRMTTSNTNGAGCVLTQGGTAAGTPTLSQVIDTGDTFKANIAISNQTGYMRAGWINQTANFTNSTNPTSGAWWEYQTGQDSTHLRYCYGNNNQEVCASGPTFATNTWAEVEIHINNSTNSITFTSNIGGTVNTYTTSGNFDNGSNRKLGPTASCYASTNTALNCYVDYIQWSGYNTSGDAIRD